MRPLLVDDRAGVSNQVLRERLPRCPREEQHEDDDDSGEEKQHDPERGGNHAFGSMRSVETADLTIGLLVEPLPVRRLLGCFQRLDRQLDLAARAVKLDTEPPCDTNGRGR